jgi:threonine/homoserine/homoserine lactone efflux protein
MIELGVGLILGLLINIPVGPINVLVVNSTLRKGIKSGISVGLGGAFMDFVYFFLILSGLRLFTLPKGFDFYYQLIGSIIILLLGIKEIYSKQSLDLSSENKGSHSTYLSHFFLGTFLYISNPALVVSMTAIAVYLKGLGVVDEGLKGCVSVSTGIFLGSTIWFFFLGKLVEKFKDSIIDKYYPFLVKTSGVLLILFGSYFLIQIAKSI